MSVWDLDDPRTRWGVDAAGNSYVRVIVRDDSGNAVGRCTDTFHTDINPDGSEGASWESWEYEFYFPGLDVQDEPAPGDPRITGTYSVARADMMMDGDAAANRTTVGRSAWAMHFAGPITAASGALAGSVGGWADMRAEGRADGVWGCTCSHAAPVGR